MEKNNIFPSSIRSYHLILCAKNLTFRSCKKRLAAVLVLMKQKSSSYIILGLNAKECVDLRSSGVDFFTESDFEHEPFLQDVNAAAVQLAAKWYESKKAQELLSWKYTNLGSLIQHSLTYFLLEPLRDIAILCELTERRMIHASTFVELDSGKVVDLSMEAPEGMLQQWYGGGVLLPQRSSHCQPDNILRIITGPLWVLWNFLLGLKKGRLLNGILVSSDLKHVEPILPFLDPDSEQQLIFVRDQYAPRLLPRFVRNGISLYKINAPLNPRVMSRRWAIQLADVIEASDVFMFRGIAFFRFIKDRFTEKP